MAKRLGPLLAAASLLLLTGDVARASSIAYTLTNNTPVGGLSDPPYTLGFEFAANSNISVTAVGVFDATGTGLADSYPVGIWDTNETLLGSAVVPSGVGDGQFCFAPMPPVDLIAGQRYWIGALYTDDNDSIVFPMEALDFSTDPAISFIQNAYSGNAWLSFPSSTTSSSPAYFGPNFIFEPTGSLVPEPGSVTLLLLGGAGLLTVRRRLPRNR